MSDIPARQATPTNYAALVAKPCPPLALLEGQTFARLFESTEDVLRYVEAIDVMNGEFTVLDADGRVVRRAADSDRGPVTAQPLDE